MLKREYLHINFNQDPKIIGPHIPQICEITGGFSHQIYELKNEKHIEYNKCIRYELPSSVFLGIGKLKDRTKLTAVLSDSYSLSQANYSGLIVNETIKNNLENYNLGIHRFYNLPILYCKQIFKYFYLAVNNSEDMIKNTKKDIDIFFKIRDEIFQDLYFSKRIWNEVFAAQDSRLIIVEE